MVSTKTAPEFHPSVYEVLQRLKDLGVPVLSFAQTVFWDDPMKAVLLRAMSETRCDNPFIAGIHDTDYFSKLAHVPKGEGRYLLVTRNDGSTKELWAATAETAAIFGSETPTPIARLQTHGVSLSKVIEARDDFQESRILDDLTEAWGWKAVAFRGENAPVAREVQLAEVIGCLQSLVNWGIEQSLALLHWTVGADKSQHERAAEEFRGMLRRETELHESETLSDFYASVLPLIYRWLLRGPGAGEDPFRQLQISACSHYFRFDAGTAGLPRFQILQRFLDRAEGPILCEAYNQVLAGSGIYELERFGVGALPFDLVIPGRGRGTLLVSEEQCSVHLADHEVTICEGEPVTDPITLAQRISSRFGDGCALLGKALMLPVMFAHEGVMALNEGASAYIPRTQQWVRAVREHGILLPLSPLLRLRYRTWDALRVLEAEFHLPQHLQESFCHRTNPFTAKSFATRWRDVLHEQQQQLDVLRDLRSTRELIPFLAQDSTCGPSHKWNTLLEEYLELTQSVHELAGRLDDYTRRIDELKAKRREHEASIADLEHRSGLMRRSLIGDSPLSAGDREELSASRQSLLDEINRLRARIREVEAERKKLGAEANRLRLSSNYQSQRQRRREIELEAEQQRLRLVRNALLTQGLEAANRRPCAWWFPLVDPSMQWWEEVVRTTEMYFEEWR